MYAKLEDWTRTWKLNITDWLLFRIGESNAYFTAGSDKIVPNAAHSVDHINQVAGQNQQLASNHVVNQDIKTLTDRTGSEPCATATGAVACRRCSTHHLVGLVTVVIE